MAPLLALLLCTLPCILLASASVSPFPPLPSSRPFPSHGDGEGLHILRAPGSAAPSSSSASRRLRTGLSRVAEPNTNDWGLPFVPAGKLLLDLDPHTTVIDGAVTAASPSYTRSIVFNPATESVCFFLNNSVKVLSITLEFPGGLPALSQPVDMGYLESVPEWGTKAYQSAIIKPSMFARTSLCNFAGNNSLLPSCQVDLTIQSAPPGASVPFHLSIMQMPVLPLGTSSGLVGGEAGQLISYAMDAHQSDLPIVVWLLSEQTDPEQLSNHMLYWFNARNPLQYLSPERSQFAEHKERGELIGMGFGPSYGSRAAPTSTQPISRKLPSSGGNARADPLYFRGPAASPILAGDSELWDELYIACAWPLGDSRASFGTDTHRFTMDFVRNYAVESMEVNLGLSMFGVVGALTVLVLCLFSAAAIVIKRRSQANQLHVEEMAAIGLVLRRNREGADAADAADRPAFDAEGRPLRYDAHGRLIPDLGAKKEVVAALPTRVFVSGMLPDEDAHCTICLGEYEAGESIKELPCAHVFHDAVSTHAKSRSPLRTCCLPLVCAQSAHSSLSSLCPLCALSVHLKVAAAEGPLCAVSAEAVRGRTAGTSAAAHHQRGSCGGRCGCGGSCAAQCAQRRLACSGSSRCSGRVPDRLALSRHRAKS